jgi:hypothetical protein
LRVLRLLPVVLLAALGGAPAAQAHGGGSGPAIQVVASGLVSPRHLAFGSRGDLFVTEAGAGGSDLCFAGGEGPACMGATGAVTEVNRWGRQFRIIDKLPSMANTPGNTNGIGPHGIAVLGEDQVFITNGGPTEPKVTPTGPDISREELATYTPQADLFGRVLWIRHHRALKVADIWDFERRVNPDATVGNPAVDSNAVDLLFDGSRIVVADAGGNALDVVRPFGRVTNLQVFANRTVPSPFGGPAVSMQFVPTSVVKGPDGFYYMSQLTGFPFPTGGANIYRVDPRTGATTVFASGFTNLMDLAFGRDGTLYALSIDDNSLLTPGTDGAIYAVSRDGAARKLALPAGTLTEPGGITVGRDGLYVSNFGGDPQNGQVLRIRGRF